MVPACSARYARSSARLRAPALTPATQHHIHALPLAGLPFNRGWVKNAGFLEAELDDADTVFFHDVDLLPGPSTVYPAVAAGTVLHLYGHTHCLGGVVGMTAAAFRRLGGFPAGLWAWGHEDTALQLACVNAGVRVDREVFTDRFTDDDAWREMDGAGRPMSGKQAMAEFVHGLRSGRKHTATPPERALVGGLESTLFSIESSTAAPAPPPQALLTALPGNGAARAPGAAGGGGVVHHVVVGFRKPSRSPAGQSHTAGSPADQSQTAAERCVRCGQRGGAASSSHGHSAICGDGGTGPEPAAKRQRTSAANCAADRGPGRRRTAPTDAAPSRAAPASRPP